MAEENPYLKMLAEQQKTAEENPYLKMLSRQQEAVPTPAPTPEKPGLTAADVIKSAGPIGIAARASDLLTGGAVTRAIPNIPESAANFAGSVAQPFLHPIDTATALKNVALGVAEKAGVKSGTENIQYADAVGKFFMDRYGSLENAKKTLETDPVGVAADLSTFLTGGAATVARVPGVVGNVARTVGTIGRTIDPLAAVAPVARATSRVASEGLGLSTGAGGEAIRTAAGAGYTGGAPAQAFQENIRGAAPMADAVTNARDAVAQLRQQRGAAYSSGMIPIANDKTILDFTGIDNANYAAQQMRTYKGQNLAPSTTAVAQKLQDAISNWRTLPASEYHTAEGLDALKQQIGDIRENTPYGTPERKMASDVYNAVRHTIVAQAPEYAKVMKGYEEATNQVKEIERTLSLNPNASVDTALRKLQSVLRNNVNTNYGNRAGLVDVLTHAGAPNLMEALAGQALNSALPRGLSRLGAQVGMEMLLAGLGHAATGPVGLSAGAAALPLSSPRLVGETAYYGGQGARVAQPFAKPVTRGAFQVGRQQQ